MAYTLNYSGGTITVTDGTLNNTNTSLALPGRNYSGYGSPVDQNLVSMLENFAYYSSSPPNPIKGQLWFDTNTNLLKYNVGTTGSPNWSTVAGIGNNVTFGNLTLTGNLTATSGTVSANAVVTNTLTVNTNLVTAVQTGITAAGTTQGTAYALTKDINVVSTSTAGADGVLLPAVPTGGYRITIINQDSGDAVKVYPAGSAQINSLGASVAYSLVPGGRLDFVAISSAQWYTLNATYG